MALLKTTWHHIRRSPYQAIATAFIMLQTFLVISIFTFIVLGSQIILNYFESLPQVAIFFKNEAKQENIDALKEQIQSTGKASKVKFVSKEEALKIYKEQNKEDPMLLELVTSDFLPASLQISTAKIEDLSQIADLAQSSSFVDKIILPKDVVSKLTVWTSALRKIGIGLISVLIIDSIFIMAIMIGIQISKKREEIEIMRLIGATNWYIRWPFIYEAVIYGIIGATIGFLISVGFLWYITPFLKWFLYGVPIFPVPFTFLLEMLGAELILAIVLGIFSSFIAVFKYLK